MHDLQTIEQDRIKILYIDDDLDQLLLFQLKFKNKFEVFVAESGQNGLEILKNNKGIDVVISDYNMPSMNGLEFIEEARKIKNNIPFYILSSSPETCEISEAIQNKLIDYFFKKPFVMNYIINEIYIYYKYDIIKTLHNY